MNKLVVLSLGNGNLHNGFPTVTAQFWETGEPQPMEFRGSLPAAPDIAQLYRDWQLLYLALHRRLGLSSRIEIEAADVTNVSEVEFSELCQQLSEKINSWLNSEQFRKIDQKLRTILDPSEEIRVIIATNDNLLRRLPWHLWNFFEDYPNAEVALSTLEYQRQEKSRQPLVGTKVRILAILGNSKGIDVEKDRTFLEQLSDRAETKFLVEPQRRELNDQLWKDWDILFFAGHSSSQEKGLIRLNQTDSLTLDQLRYALKKAIERGLKLAIFNSCDGLGLAQSLSDLHIPQVIVMREPVPDMVAQEFLRHFLATFSSGESLYGSVRDARERLQGLEGESPCATWLPVICQNPAEAPMTWSKSCRTVPPKLPTSPRRNRLRTVLLASAIATAAILGVRHLGMLQAWELLAYDQLMRLRSEEGFDQRLLIVKVTEDDFQKLGEYPLSDRTVVRLLKKLDQYQPQVIGLDIYRDIPQGEGRADLLKHLQHSEHLIGVCKIPDQNDAGIKPPPGMSETSLGFSDVMVDRDQILRRHLLSNIPPTASGCTTNYALSLQLAFLYLDAKGILINTANNLQLGKVVFKQLKSPTGGYQQVDVGGYQVMLNYRSPLNIAPQVNITDILNDQINPDYIKNRIVLIGVDTDNIDRYFTPYSAGQGSYQSVAGVIVQAQMVSQILSAVLDGRPLLTTWPQWSETLWIWGWSLVGGILVWRFRSMLPLGLIASLVVLHIVCFDLLKTGNWVPLVPSALALVVTSGSVVAYTAFQVKRNQ